MLCLSTASLKLHGGVYPNEVWVSRGFGSFVAAAKRARCPLRRRFLHCCSAAAAVLLQLAVSWRILAAAKAAVPLTNNASPVTSAASSWKQMGSLTYITDGLAELNTRRESQSTRARARFASAPPAAPAAQATKSHHSTSHTNDFGARIAYMP